MTRDDRRLVPVLPAGLELHDRGAPASIVEVLRARAGGAPEGRAYTFLADGETETHHLSYADLDRRARAIAARLQERGLQGERALLLYPPGLEFVAAFFGCLYGAVVAIPAYPPRPNRSQVRLRSIVEDAAPRVVLTTAALLSRATEWCAELPQLLSGEWIATDALESSAEAWREPALGGDTLAFLQYTSGSTAAPKGVMVSHGNLLHNEEAIRQAFGQSESSVIVGWLPLYHDMGLIGNVLQPCYVGARCILMPPVAFLQKPLRWLKAISRFRATTSGGPNFAYDLCVRSFDSEEVAGLDLSCWSTAFNGAEPVRHETLDRFARAFAPAGFRREAFYPCYGLAEATLFAAGGTPGRRPEVRDVDAAGLERNLALPSASGERGGRRLVSCGRPWLEQSILIVDPDSGASCAEGQVGEIWVGGASVAQGYWGKPEETARAFRARLAARQGPFLRTGDLGFLDGGELFVTGRLKDLIILRGRNHYPQDIELTVENSHPGLRPGSGAAFSVEVSGEERLVVVQEMQRHPRASVDAIAEAVRRAVSEEHEVQVHELVLLQPGSIPKTSSGKIQRRECRARYLAGDLVALHRSVTAQSTLRRLLTRSDLLALDPPERTAVLTAWLADEIARRGGVAAERLDLEATLAAAGLDSLAIFDLQARLEADLGLAPSVASLTELSIAALRDHLVDDLGKVSDGEIDGLPPLVPSKVLGDHPLSPGQEALWFLEQSMSGEGVEGVFHIAAATRLGSEVDGAALLRASVALSARHPALRTTYLTTDGAPCQRVHASLPPDLGEVGATEWSAEDLDGELRREARRRFDLAQGPPLRLRVFARPGGERVLLLVLHHLAGDFWSLAVLLRDWAALYARERGADRPPLPDLPAAYTDFVRWQRRLLAGPVGERLERAWLDRLRGAPLSIDLPTDWPRPRVATHAGALLGLQLGPETTGRLRDLGRAHGATLFTTLLAVFQVLLGRLTGQEDFLIGSPATGRRDRHLDGVVGYFVNPIVLRADLADDPPFLAFLERTRQTVAEALELRDLPFAQLTRRLQPVRDPARPPIFQVQFALQRAAPLQDPGLAAFAVAQAGARIELEGLVLESLRLDPGTAQLDLTLSAAEVRDTLVLSCEYDTALFDRVTVERWLGHLRTLLDAAAASPETRLGELPLLTPAESHQVLAEWNDTGGEGVWEGPVSFLVELRARERPADPAVVEAAGRVLTYGELAERAGRLAGLLQALGAGPETVVGVLAERSPELLTGLLGILKAGAAYLPLDPSYPAERLALMLSETAAPVLLTQETLLDRVPATQARIVCLDRDWEEIERRPPVPAAMVEPDHLAYVLYTSGSTGRPKGVQIPHRGLMNLVRWDLRAYGTGPGDHRTQVASLGFDASVWEIWPCLASGAALHLPKEEERLDAQKLGAWMAAGGITVSFLPTPLAEALLAAGGPEIPTLRRLLVGGDRLRLYPASSSGFTLVNHYGPTEASVVTSAGPVAPRHRGEPGPAPSLGRPIDGLRVYLLDPSLLPVAPGVPGELWVGGPSLARGYLGDPGRTAERFAPDPFGQTPGGRLYRTGDLCRHRRDGSLEFLGRIDHQVKIRGFRVELGEIEAVLSQHAGVSEAVVVLWGEGEEKRLVTYVVGQAGVEELRRHAQERLPEHMVPVGWVFLEALPLTAHGKVDRKALPPPKWQSEHEADLPGGTVQELLATIWAEVLGIEEVGAQDDFFELGGHSLLATRVTSRVREAFGVALPIRSLFERPRLEDLAAEVARLAGGHRRAVDLSLIRVPRDGPLPLSFAQQRLWFLDALEDSSAAYNVPASLRLRGPLDVVALAATLREIGRRHESLRTAFPARDGEPCQSVLPGAGPELPVADLTGLPEAGAELRRLTRREARRPFDLAAGPLWRTLLVRLDDEDHALLLVLHHIVCDGWSLAVLAEEMEALYSACSSRSASPLPEPAIQYADYAWWQRQWLAAHLLDEQLEHWRSRLSGHLPVLELPADRQRPPAQSFRGSRQYRELPPRLAGELQALARREGATPFMTFTAAVQTLLHRMTGQDDLLLGTPMANRDRLEIESLVGCLVNTVVLRTAVVGDLGWSDLLRRVRDGVLEADAHQDIPFEHLVQILPPERELSHNPLFQVMVLLEGAPRRPFSLRGLDVRMEEIETGTSKLDLTLCLLLGESGVSLRAEYSTDLFDGSTIERWLGHLGSLLEGVVADPQARLRDLPWMSQAERQQIVLEWNDTAVAYETAGLCLPDLIEAQARRTPEGVAVVFEGACLSYGELDRRSNGLARHLRALGVGPEVRVGLCLERSLELMIGLVAVLKAGGAYVPLDPEYPRERLDWMVQDSGVAVVVIQARLAGALAGFAGTLVRLDEDWGEIARYGEEPLCRDLEPDNLAYLIYTSGSTGRPKGAMNAHRGVVNRLLWMQEVFGLGADDAVVQKTPASFDVSVWELFWPLLVGARLVVARPGGHREGAYLVELLRREAITTVHFVPSMLRAFLAEDGVEGCTSLRRVVASGEALTPDLVGRFVQRLGCGLYNLYGPTEAAVDVTWWDCSVASGPGGVPIGRPISNLQVYVLDAEMDPLPVGAVGEVYLGGVGLGRGYWSRPELTAERFVPDPLGVEMGDRLYRTGDLGRLRSDGPVEYVGRVDYQVKIRGFRIELGEVEAALDQHPAVAQSVAGVQGEGGDQRLIAYLRLQPGEGDPGASELRAFLQASLPEFMVPSAFLVLSELPLTPSGKVDRKALPALEQHRPEESYLAPRTPVEEVLAGIWTELLGVDRIGTADHFFDLGGHSLVAMRVISRLRSVFGVELPLRVLFEAPTLADLAARVEAARQDVPPPVRRTDRQGSLPLSSAQERLWFLDRLQPESSAYNMVQALRADGSLELPALEASLREVARRHEVLRTRFAERNGEPVQEIVPAGDWGLALVDLSGLAEPGREAEARRQVEREAVRPFDLSQGRLLRCTVLRLGSREHVLVVNIHHIAADGWSVRLLIEEVGFLYAAAVSGRPSPLPELPIQYVDFAVWQRDWLQGGMLERQLGYWRQRLEGLPPLELLTDRPRPTLPSLRGGSVPWAIGPALTEELRSLSRRAGATLFMSLVAGFSVLLSRYAGQQDLGIGTPIAGRRLLETEGLIGFFVNNLVLRQELTGNPEWAEWLSRVRRDTLEAYAHQDLPFERLVEELRPERRLSYNPLFQVVLTLQNAPRERLELGDLSLEPWAIASMAEKFDLTLSLGETEQGLTGSLQYSRDLFDRATVARMARHLELLLAGAAARPDSALLDLPWVSEPERQQLTLEWTGEGGEGDGYWKLVHELFEQQADQAPDAVAAVYEGFHLTYGELERRANQLGRRLRRLGVGADVRVGVCLERSLEVVVSLLGVLKSGGAYLPLDADYPRERLAFMLRDGEVSVLVTHADLLGRLPQHDLPTVLVERGWKDLATESPARLGFAVTRESLAYVMYTSGSTGRPKGTSIPHRALSWFVATLSYVEPSRGDRFAQGSTHTFDAATFELWGALAHGACVVGIPKEVMISPPDLARRLRHEGITVMYLTAALFRQTAGQEPQAFEGLRRLLVGGEVVEPSFFQRVLAGGAPQRLLYLYGPTETTVFSSWYAVREVPGDGGRVSIGRPIDDAPHYPLDPALRPVPTGVAGEIHIGGEGLARGYLGRPDLTAERFLPSPFGNAPGSRVYRTGDLGRYLPDGRLEFLGRVDDQVKVRGMRVELREIESVLLRHPRVEEAVAVLREDRLVAYVASRLEPLPSARELRALLASELPDYMVPAAYVMLPALPLSSHGKVDRKALPAPEQQVSLADWVGPRTPVEEVLAGLWADVLGGDLVGVHDDFFESGGHSLLAIRLLSRIQETLRVELSVRDLFEAPTVAGLAHRVEAALRSGAPAPPPIVPVARGAGLPLSFSQQRLWFLDQLEPDSALYNISVSLRATGRLKVAALGYALGETMRRHEALRTVFATIDGLPVQVILPVVPLALPVVDLSGLVLESREVEALRLAGEEAERPFDLRRGPLFRASLLRLGEEEHIALISMHHIVSDGWSVDVLLREMSLQYEGWSLGIAAPLPAMPIQYADFSAWQRSWLQGKVLEHELGYWRGQLAGAQPVLALPTDRPRPAVQGFRGAVRPLHLSAPLSLDLRALCRRSKTTLFMTLLAGFQMLLARYAGHPDVSVGTPIAGRGRVELEGLIGFFVNTLVLRTLCHAELSFLELLARVRECSIAAHAHQHLPFEKLVEEMAPERNLAHSPLFQAMFLLQGVNLGGAEVALPGLALHRLETESRTAKFDLTLFLAETADGLTGECEYDRDLFDASTVDRLLGHFLTLLEGLAANPDESISQLPLLSEAERRELLLEWNATAGEFPRRSTLPELLAAQVELRADEPAVLWGEGRLTYGELGSRAGRLAGRLRRLGVGPDVVVGLLCERSPEMVIGVLAVLEAGGAYLPLDPALPPARLAFLAEDAGVRVILAQEHLRRLLPAVEVPVFPLEPQGDDSAAEPVPDSARRAEPENLAYVLYTSGSTGTPKGVMIPHQGLLNYLTWALCAYEVEPGCIAPLHSPLGFDLTVTSLFLPLLAGGSVLLLPEQPGVDALADALRSHTFGLVKVTPAHLVLLEEALGDMDLSAHRGVMVVGGEALFAERAAWWRRCAPGIRLINEYGPTETVVGCCTYEVTGLAAGRSAVPIGRPIANTRLYLLDAALQPVPRGVSGGLYVAGEGVARGYLGRPERTAERFLPDPFSNEPGARLYRTGDLARRLPTGELEFLGRDDHQVKVRGFRVEPGEVEAALAEHSAVRGAVVLSNRDAAHGIWLAGYVDTHKDAQLTPDELRRFLAGKLPPYMVPSTLRVLDRLPVTANGKVDRQALAALSVESDGSGKTSAAPRTPIEELLAGLWAEVLGRDRIGTDENFFDLGGHSLLATQAMAKMRRMLGVELPLRAMFEAPTVSGLAQRVAGALRAGEGLRVPAIEPVPRLGMGLPLSFAQKRLWFLDQLEPGSPVYNVSVALRMTGRLDLPALAATLAEMVRRHEVLRTRFESTRDVHLQVIAPPSRAALPVVDLSGLPAREEEVWSLGRDQALRPFDLARGPLFRSLVLRLGPLEHMAIFTLHHIVSDAWSMGLLVRELSLLYSAVLAGRPSPLAELPVQYADFAVWQQEWMRGEVLERQLAYWRGQLLAQGEPQALELPADRPRPATPTHHGARVPVVFSADLTAAAHRLSRRAGATLFMTLLAAFQTLLHRHTGARDFAIGTAIANRNHPELEALIGFFVNTLVMRVEIAKDLSVEDLLAHVREVALGAFAHQDLPFEKLVEELAPERNLSRTPFFQQMFILQNTPLEDLQLPELEVHPCQTPGVSVDFDLTLSVEERKGGLQGFLEYSADLFDAATISRLARSFETLLWSLVSARQGRLSELSSLNRDERHQLLYEWNDTSPALPSEACCHQLFTRTALQSPDSVAAIFGQGFLTYGELNRRADLLSGYLRTLGVGPEDRVAIFVERSFEMLIGMMAVLKAGGSYVPLDPSYPSDRISYMQKDSGAKVLLSQHHLVSRLADFGGSIVLLDEDWIAVERLGLGRTEDAGYAESPAYTIYTSGSTGLPKGSVIPHQALTTYALALIRKLDLQRTDRILQFAALSFDVAVEEIFPALLAGGTVVLRDPLDLASLEGFERALEEGGVTVVELPTAFWHGWVYDLARSGKRPPACLRLVLIGGELISPERLDQWLELSVPLANVFGLTEVTVTSTVHKFRAGEGTSNLAVGRPLLGNRIYVLDEDWHPLPMGISGQLFLGGSCLARCYLDRPSLTAERFLPDPLSEELGGRMYRTGDLVRIRPDGILEFLGRLDHQVKIRGFRVELGEVEAALARHPGVREVVVVARREKAGTQALDAYVVPRQEPASFAGGMIPVSESQRPDLSAEKLRSFLQSSLPEYMVPSSFTVLDRLPVTPNGKLDRKALPVPHRESQEDAYSLSLPRSPIQEMLAGIWSDVLGHDGFHGDSSFFEHGGHSLLAIQVVSRIRQVFGVELALAELFEATTLGVLAERIEVALRKDGEEKLPAIERVSRQGELPLSFAQQRLWFVHQIQPDTAAYNISTSLRLTGAFSIPVLASALNEVVRRHEALRTRFESRNGRAVQVIRPEMRLALPVVDLSVLPGDYRGAEAKRLVAQQAEMPLALDRAPLLRALVLQLEREDHAFLLTLHHIVSDGWSTSILIQEVSVLYASFAAGLPSPLPELPVQYVDFSLWQRRCLEGEAMERSVRYWKQRLAGAPAVLKLPTDRPRPPLPSYRGALKTFVVPHELSQEIVLLARHEGGTLFMTLLAVFKALIHAWCGEDDIVVGSNVAGRNHTEIEGLIGFFVNMLVLRTDLSGNPTFRDLLARVREVALASYAHQDVPLERIVDELKLNRNLSYSPLFQVVFTLQNIPFSEVALDGVEIVPFEAEVKTTQFDLIFNVTEKAEGLHLAIQYSVDLFDAPTIDRLAHGFEVLLRTVAVRPDVRLNEMKRELLDAGGREWERKEEEFGLLLDKAFRTARRRPVARSG